MLLAGTRIGIARDAAFAFIYRGNVELLDAMGAKLRFFSPLADDGLPDVDALWLPGGYPEPHAARLAANRPLREAVRAHHAAAKPILAECGGMMACMERLVDGNGQPHDMFGLLPGQSVMVGRLAGLGQQSLTLPGGELRGHTFHHSRLETTREPAAQTHRNRGGTPGEAVYRDRRLTASYFHGHFPSAPEAVASLLTAS